MIAAAAAAAAARVSFCESRRCASGKEIPTRDCSFSRLGSLTDNDGHHALPGPVLEMCEVLGDVVEN